jgi:hypothetical protein
MHPSYQTKQTLQVGDSAGRKLCPDLPYKKDKQRHIITPRLPDRHKGCPTNSKNNLTNTVVNSLGSFLTNCTLSVHFGYSFPWATIVMLRVI